MVMVSPKAINADEHSELHKLIFFPSPRIDSATHLVGIGCELSGLVSTEPAYLMVSCAFRRSSQLWLTGLGSACHRPLRTLA